MEEDEQKRREQVAQTTKRTMYLSMALFFPLWLIILFMVSGNSGNAVPFSPGAFIQPYSGEQSSIAIALGAVAVLDFLLMNLYFIPLCLKSLGNELPALSVTETFGIFGFIIGFMNSNPWAAVPYLAIGLGNYVYVYSKLNEAKTGGLGQVQ